MKTIYDTEVKKEDVIHNLDRIQSQIFKLLPMREENLEWDKPLETLILELCGLNALLDTTNEKLLTLCSKLQGLLVQKDEDNFMLYRRTIFECCGLIDKIKISL